MKKLLLAFAILASAAVCRADDKIWFQLGSLDFKVPFHTVNAVGLWDGVGKQFLAGAETPLVQWKQLQFVGGAVTTLENDAAGTPYIGFHVVVANPLENFVGLSSFQPGIFGGYNFRASEWLLGLKASVGLF